MTMKALLALALAAQGLSSQGPAPAAIVTVTVTGIKANIGKVIASICGKKQFMVSRWTYSKAASVLIPSGRPRMFAGAGRG